MTEQVTGIDLIKQQIRIAAGEKLPFKQKDIPQTGHAIECRINAEDPARNFAPCPGEIRELRLPGGPGVRLDTHVYAGYRIPPNYDSMIGKLIVHRPTRAEAIATMHRALQRVPRRPDQDHHPAAPADHGQPELRQRRRGHGVRRAEFAREVATYNLLRQEGGFDSNAYYINDAPKGQPPRQIERIGPSQTLALGEPDKPKTSLRSQAFATCRPPPAPAAAADGESIRL